MPHKFHKQLSDHNLLMRASLAILRAVTGAGGAASKEHPADPKKDPLPSIWATREWTQLATAFGFVLHMFDQCRYGTTSTKPTCIGATYEMKGVDGLRCNHGGHPPLIGRDSEGNFKTKGAQAYPEKMCEMLAFHIIEAMRQRGPSHLDQELEESEGEEEVDPERGMKMIVPPIALSWDPLTRWRECFRWRWREQGHINHLECLAFLAAVRHHSRAEQNWGKRILVMTDSQVTMATISKGRSSRPLLNRVARTMSCFQLVFGIRAVARWVPTKRNHADGPSRGCAIGVAPENLEPHTCKIKMPKAVFHLPG